VKSITNRERPDGSNHLSFPSGHTATAFVAAEFLHQEYGCKSVWIDIAGYGTAAFVGVARVYKNRHWLSDVVAGAGVGILTTKGVYWVYPRLKMKWFGKHEHGEALQFMPVVECNGGGANLALVCRF
jgi:membrane-associated phospholipid phosphatase